MNKEAVIANNKYCVIRTNDKCHILIKKNQKIDFESLLVLENHLEEEQESLRKLMQAMGNNDDYSQFHALLGIGSLLLTSIMIDKIGLKEPILAPLTMTSFAAINIIKSLSRHYILRRKIPIIEANIKRIQSILLTLREKAMIIDQEVLLYLDSDVSCYKELHYILESYLQDESITDEKHLVLKV